MIFYDIRAREKSLMLKKKNKNKYLVFLFSIVFLFGCQVGDEGVEDVLSRAAAFVEEDGEYVAEISELDNASLQLFSGTSEYGDITSFGFDIENEDTGEGELDVRVLVEIEEHGGFEGQSIYYDIYSIEVEGSYYFIETEMGLLQFEIISETAVSDEGGGWYSIDRIIRSNPPALSP